MYIPTIVSTTYKKGPPLKLLIMFLSSGNADIEKRKKKTHRAE